MQTTRGLRTAMASRLQVISIHALQTLQAQYDDAEMHHFTLAQRRHMLIRHGRVLQWVLKRYGPKVN